MSSDILATRSDKRWRTLDIRLTTRWTGDCDTCGKKDVIFSGTPSGSFRARVPISDRDYRLVCENLFWIAAEYELKCNNGYSHVATGYKKTDDAFTISTEPYKQGYKEQGRLFEEVLTRFIPNFVKLLTGQLDVETVQQITEGELRQISP